MWGKANNGGKLMIETRFDLQPARQAKTSLEVLLKVLHLAAGVALIGSAWVLGREGGCHIFKIYGL